MQSLRDRASAYTLNGKPLHERLHVTCVLKSLAGLISEVVLGDSSRDYCWSLADLDPHLTCNAARCLQPMQPDG